MEKMYISIAQDESVEEQAHKDLKAKVAEQSDNPDIMNAILECLKALKWSSRILATSLKMLKSLALTSEPHKQKLLTSVTRKELRTFADNFFSHEDIQADALILIALFKEAKYENMV